MDHPERTHVVEEGRKAAAPYGINDLDNDAHCKNEGCLLRMDPFPAPLNFRFGEGVVSQLDPISEPSSQNDNQGSSTVTINVGGTIFKVGIDDVAPSTLLLTLVDAHLSTSVENRVNHEAEKGKNGMKQVEWDDLGNIYIDRNPAEFSRILGYVRDGYLDGIALASQMSSAKNDWSGVGPTACTARLLVRSFEFYGLRRPDWCSKCGLFYDFTRHGGADACHRHVGDLCEGSLQGEPSLIWHCCNMPAGSPGCQTAAHCRLGDSMKKEFEFYGSPLHSEEATDRYLKHTNSSIDGNARASVTTACTATVTPKSAIDDAGDLPHQHAEISHPHGDLTHDELWVGPAETMVGKTIHTNVVSEGGENGVKNGSTSIKKVTKGSSSDEILDELKEKGDNTSHATHSDCSVSLDGYETHSSNKSGGTPTPGAEKMLSGDALHVMATPEQHPLPMPPPHCPLRYFCGSVDAPYGVEGQQYHQSPPGLVLMPLVHPIYFSSQPYYPHYSPQAAPMPPIAAGVTLGHQIPGGESGYHDAHHYDTHGGRRLNYATHIDQFQQQTNPATEAHQLRESRFMSPPDQRDGRSMLSSMHNSTDFDDQDKRKAEINAWLESCGDSTPPHTTTTDGGIMSESSSPRCPQSACGTDESKCGGCPFFVMEVREPLIKGTSDQPSSMGGQVRHRYGRRPRTQVAVDVANSPRGHPVPYYVDPSMRQWQGNQSIPLGSPARPQDISAKAHNHRQVHDEPPLRPPQPPDNLGSPHHHPPHQQTHALSTPSTRSPTIESLGGNPQQPGHVNGQIDLSLAKAISPALPLSMSGGDIKGYPCRGTGNSNEHATSPQSQNANHARRHVAPLPPRLTAAAQLPPQSGQPPAPPPYAHSSPSFPAYPSKRPTLPLSTSTLSSHKLNHSFENELSPHDENDAEHPHGLLSPRSMTDRPLVPILGPGRLTPQRENPHYKTRMCQLFKEGLCKRWEEALYDVELSCFMVVQRAFELQIRPFIGRVEAHRPIL
eukprot:GHVN01089928.1.p1 GENE.GHVN01089928.1~~GHVN01089928.1.p1  ORF type:complete len:1003 (+),score=155.67 GHVN01089928.1:1021-4029(+)